jgi:hypothetical protein
MNEIIPTPGPDDQPGNPPSVPIEYKMPAPISPPGETPLKSEGPGTGICIGMGVLLCIGSVALCLLIPPIFLAGLALAIASLFIKGYRGVFLGYVLTMGVALLVTIIVCAGHPMDLH